MIEHQSKIPVLIIDDSPVFMEALTRLIQSSSDFYVAGTMTGEAEVLDRIILLAPRVVLIDTEMTGSLKLISKIKLHFSERIVIGMALDDTFGFRRGVFNAGADGFIAKEMLRAELFSLILYLLNQ